MKKLTIEIECGEKTCAIEKGKFCPYLCTTRMGTIPYCGIWYDQDRKGMPAPLESKNGWLQRRPECLASENTKPANTCGVGCKESQIKTCKDCRFCKPGELKLVVCAAPPPVLATIISEDDPAEDCPYFKDKEEKTEHETFTDI
jgi:hypothetical protein